MHSIIDKIKSYSEQIDLEERFIYDFKIDVSVLEAHIIEKLAIQIVFLGKILY